MLSFQACSQNATTSQEVQYDDELEIVVDSISTDSISIMSNHFSNRFFSIDYPDTYQIYQENNQVTADTSISLQIMEIQKNDYDFLANINIIVSGTKRLEPTATLVQIGPEQMSRAFTDYQVLRQIDNVVVSLAKGSVVECKWGLNGYSLSQHQYVVKKADNTTYTITLTWDSAHPEQKEVLQNILGTLNIK